MKISSVSHPALFASLVGVAGPVAIRYDGRGLACLAETCLSWAKSGVPVPVEDLVLYVRSLSSSRVGRRAGSARLVRELRALA